MPAPRRPQNRGLEPNLYTHPLGGFRWRHPRTWKYHYFGKVDRAAANEAARSLNLHFAAKSSIFDRIVAQDSETLRSVIEFHNKDRIRQQRVSERTKENRVYILRKLAATELASLDVSAITTRDVALYLESLPTDSMRQQYRAQLMAIFKTAIQRGLVERNPVADTDAPNVERKRDRLTEEGYKAIYALAKPWMRNLMDLLRLTLQRPEDLLGLKWDAFTGTELRVEQGKTGARLAIHARPDLLEVLKRCRDGVASPFIIHRIPERIKAREQRSVSREHHTQILRSQASKAFIALVRACDTYKGQKNPPTLYECKSFGIAQLRNQGWTLQDVQRLAGHRTPRMTEHYAKGHEAPFDPVGSPPNGERFVTDLLVKRY